MTSPATVASTLMLIATTTRVALDLPGPPLHLEVQWVGRRSQGDRTPLMVFLHEGLGSVSMWRDFPQRLCDAAGCLGLVYSRPGYGRSTPRAPHTYFPVDFMHRQAFEVLPSVLRAVQVDPEAQPLWLFGHSDGGSIALLHAARFAPAGIVVLAPHIRVEAISLTRIASARHAYLHTDLRSKLARHHDDPDSAFWGWNTIWLDPAFAHWSIEAELAAIRCPVLALQGEDDEYGTLAQIDGIGQRVNCAQTVALAACGHSPHRDQPEQVITHTVAFMRTAAHTG